MNKNFTNPIYESISHRCKSVLTVTLFLLMLLQTKIVEAQTTPSTTIPPSTTPTTAPTVCAGATVTFNSSYTGSGNSRATTATRWEYQANSTDTWSPVTSGVTFANPSGNTLNTTLTLLNVTDNQNGSYRVVYIRENDNRPITTTAATLTVTPVPVVNGNLVICSGTSTTLTAGNNVSSSFRWYTESGTPITAGVSNNGINFTANPTTTTNSTVVNYFVAAVGLNNCETTRTKVTVTVNPTPNKPTITASGATTLCQNSSIKLTANAGIADQGISYLWSNGATTKEITIVNSIAGTYTYTVTASNATTCSAVSDPITITVNPLPTTPVITASGATSFCQNGSVTLSPGAETPTEGVTYLWSNGALTRTINVQEPGNYYLQVFNNTNCSATSNTIPVTVYSLPTATIRASGETTFCAGGSVTLTASEGTSYLWSNGEQTQSITVNAANIVANGEYRVTVTNENSCSNLSDITKVTINSLPVPVIAAGSAISFCQGGSVILTANDENDLDGIPDAGTTYLWSNNATTRSIEVSASSTYTVTIKYANGCSATTTVGTTVTVNRLPSASITAEGPTTFCPNGSVTLTGNSDGQNAAFTWFRNEVEVATGPNYAATSSGNYTVMAKDANTCSSKMSASVAVTVIDESNIIQEGLTTSFCTGGSTVLHALAGEGYLHIWSKVGDPTFTAIGPELTVTDAGFYRVTLTIPGGCITTSSATEVTTLQLPEATISADRTAICEGERVTLTASAGASYVWFNNGSRLSFETQVIVVNAAGNYTVTVTNENECSDTSNPVAITVNPLPAAPTISANGAATTFCEGGTVRLTASPIPDGSSYLWSNGSTSAFIDVTTTDTYTVQVRNGNGCLSAASNAIAVTVNTLPEATISADRTAICEGERVTLTASAGASYVWFLNGSRLSDETQQIVGSTAGTYTVTVTNENGCVSAISNAIAITVNPLPATPTISANGAATTFCRGGTVRLTASPIPDGSSYLWSNGSTSAFIDVTSTDTYTVQVRNGNGCLSAASNAIAVTVNSLPETPTISANGAATTFCRGGTVRLTAVGTIPDGSSYLWSNGSTSAFIDVTGSGTYTVQVINGNNCVSATSNAIAVTVNTLPVATITPNGATTFCQGGSVMLTAADATDNDNIPDEGTTYLWNTGARTQTIPVNSSGSYTVTVTKANGCFAVTSSATVVRVNPNPTLTIRNPAAVCSPNTVNLTANEIITDSNLQGGSLSYWTDAAATISLPDPSAVAISGTYYIRVQTSGGCIDIKPVVVTITPTDTYTLVLTANPFPVCQRTEYTAHVIKNITGLVYPPEDKIRLVPVTWTGGQEVTGDFTFDWVKNDERDRRNGNHGPQISESGLRSEEYYTVRARPLSPISGCIIYNNRSDLVPNPATNEENNVLFSNRIFLGVPEDYSVNISAVPAGAICPGTSVTFTATPSREYTGITYQWTINGVAQPQTDPTGKTFTSTTLKNGNVVALTFTSAEGGCGPQASNSITMIVAEQLTLNGGAYCEGSTGTVVLRNSQRGISYQLIGPGVSINPVAGTGSDIPFNGLKAGSYTVQAIVGGTTCLTYGPVTLIENPLPTASASIAPNEVPTKCAILPSTTFNLAGRATNGNFVWSVFRNASNLRVTIANVNDLNTSVTITGSGTVTLRLTTTATQTPNCGSVSNDVVLTVNPLPVAPQVVANVSLCENAPAFPLTTLSGVNLTWYRADGTVLPGAPTPSTSTIGTTRYFVSQTTNDCEGPRAEINVTVSPLPASQTVSVTNSGHYCNLPGFDRPVISLNDSEVGVIYQLTSPSGRVTEYRGTGEKLPLGNFDEEGTYTVTAINATNCSAIMGQVVIVPIAGPAPRQITGANSYCKLTTPGGVAIGLDNSQAYTTYQLMRGNEVLAKVVGNANQTGPIPFGTYTEGTYRVMAANNAEWNYGCSVEVASKTITLSDIPNQISELGIIVPDILIIGQPAVYKVNQDENSSAYNYNWTYNWQVTYSDQTSDTFDDQHGRTLTLSSVREDMIDISVTQIAPTGTDAICTESASELFTFASPVLLPVELIYLKTDKQDKNVVKVEWATAMEKDNKGFEVQVSQDAKNYRTLSFIPTQNGNTLLRQVYTFYDKESGKKGTRYYRLKQMDMNGDTKYFGPKAVKMEQIEEPTLAAYPNPFTSEVNLEFTSEESGTMVVEVTSALGAKVYEKTLKVEKGFRKETIQLSPNLANGVYIITTRMGDKTNHIRLMKQL